jgi:DNA-directed RNA polymerase subunit RPC12/RpoP
VPAKGDGAARRKVRRRGRRYHHVAAEETRAAALELLRRTRGPFPSQQELVRAVRRRLRSDDPLAVIGGPRLRRILLTTDGVRVDVEFAERDVQGPLTRCPVCGTELVPIRNRTLDAAAVTLGARCPSCGYWTHRRRRVPVRYTFRAATEGTRKRGATAHPSA